MSDTLTLVDDDHPRMAELVFSPHPRGVEIEAKISDTYNGWHDWTLVIPEARAVDLFFWLANSLRIGT